MVKQELYKLCKNKKAFFAFFIFVTIHITYFGYITFFSIAPPDLISVMPLEKYVEVGGLFAFLTIIMLPLWLSLFFIIAQSEEFKDNYDTLVITRIDYFRYVLGKALANFLIAFFFFLILFSSIFTIQAIYLFYLYGDVTQVISEEYYTYHLLHFQKDYFWFLALLHYVKVSLYYGLFTGIMTLLEFIFKDYRVTMIVSFLGWYLCTMFRGVPNLALVIQPFLSIEFGVKYIMTSSIFYLLTFSLIILLLLIYHFKKDDYAL